MIKGKELDLRYETTVDEETSTYSSTDTEGSSYADESSLLDALGIMFGHEVPRREGMETHSLSYEESEELEGRLKGMLADDLSSQEEEEYLTMLRRYPGIFITDYSQIKGVTVVEHGIEIRPETKPVAQN